MQDVNAAEIDVRLEMQARGKEEFLAALRRDLSLVPAMNISIGQPNSHRIDHMLSGARANIAVNVFGDDLRELRRIATSSGAQVPLHSLADIRKDLSPNTVSRENVQRTIAVTCNVSGRDLRSVVEEIREGIEANVRLPEGYHVEYGGQFESAEQATRILLVLGVAVVAGIFVLLFIALGSVRDAALVMANLPLALIGGVVGVFLSGGVLSVASIIGFITLFGIATRNGLMMIAHIHHLSDHAHLDDALLLVKQGAMERLSPILMTALAAGLGLIPLALAVGEPGSEIQAPMAIVILCGLLSSTALNMLVVPALYLRFGSVCERLRAAP